MTLSTPAKQAKERGKAGGGSNKIGVLVSGKTASFVGIEETPVIPASGTRPADLK